MSQEDTSAIRGDALSVVGFVVANGDPEHVTMAVRAGAIPGMCELLLDQPFSTLLAIKALSTMLAMERARCEAESDDSAPWLEQLRECGGVERLEGFAADPEDDAQAAAVRGAGAKWAVPAACLCMALADGECRVSASRRSSEGPVGHIRASSGRGTHA